MIEKGVKERMSVDEMEWNRLLQIVFGSLEEGGGEGVAGVVVLMVVVVVEVVICVDVVEASILVSSVHNLFGSVAIRYTYPKDVNAVETPSNFTGKSEQSYVRALIRFGADVELKGSYVVVYANLLGKGYIHGKVPFEYGMKTSQCANLGVPVGPKVGFKPVKQVYRQVSKKNNVNTSGNKKKYAEPTIEVSNSNPFDVLNSVENNVDLGTNGGTSNPVTLVDDEGKPLTKVDSSGDHDSEDEVASVDNDMEKFLASKKED
ncbi:hypothetical protein Tco_0929064 [Tanacetum coccineum]